VGSDKSFGADRVYNFVRVSLREILGSNMARKHIQQMNQLERAFIHGYLRSPRRDYHATVNHFQDRASERSFSVQQAVDALRNGLVVEVHNDRAPSLRALVRDKKGTCVVVELNTDMILTVYYNDPEDKHETLNWAPYRWTQDIVALVKSL
jgi:hypothetical protein